MQGAEESRTKTKRVSKAPSFSMVAQLKLVRGLTVIILQSPKIPNTNYTHYHDRLFAEVKYENIHSNITIYMQTVVYHIIGITKMSVTT